MLQSNPRGCPDVIYVGITGGGERSYTEFRKIPESKNMIYEKENLAVITLKKGEGRYLKAGGQWIYDNEIATAMGHFEDGDIVYVNDFDGYKLGKGVINRNSKIRIRMLTRDPEQVIDEEFLRGRIRDAWEYRKQVMTDEKNVPFRDMPDGLKTMSCRLVFGEADFMPGIVIDKFTDVLVIESMALGTDRLKEEIVRLTKEVLAEDGVVIRGVYERSDAKVRKLEGLEPVKGFIGDEFDTEVEIVENGVKYIVDVKDGQKTGFFLDQKYNRLAIQRLARGKRVLDMFTHTGSFALNAGIAGAREVIAVDASGTAIATANRNAELNGLSETVSFVENDAFEVLGILEEKGEKFDLVILDPPAFAKSRTAVKNAIKGYREINRRAMGLVERGGYFATCSCSHFMDFELFTKTIGQAAGNAHVRLKQVEFRTQSPDHPILWASDESYYLKFYIFQVL